MRKLKKYERPTVFVMEIGINIFLMQTSKVLWESPVEDVQEGDVSSWGDWT